MTLHLTITEYTTSLGDVVEKKKMYIKINEFDIGGTLLSRVTDTGSLLVGDGVGSLADFPWLADGMVLTADAAESLKLKWKLPTTSAKTMTNRSGVNMAAGTVCILHATANSITTTTTEGDRRISCVTSEAIADLSAGNVLFFGPATILVTGAVAVNEWLIASTTAGRAKGAGFTKPLGAIGFALSANVSGNGWVSGVIDPDHYSNRAGIGKLLGISTDETMNNAGGANVLETSRFQAIASGTMNRFKIRIGGAGGGIKVAIYADVAGAATGLPLNFTSVEYAGVGWTSIKFPDTPIVSGTYYHLAQIHAGSGMAETYTNANGYKYSSVNVFDAFPPTPGGTAIATQSLCASGWEE